MRGNSKFVKRSLKEQILFIVLTVILVAIASLSFTGCGSKKDTDTIETEISTDEETTSAIESEESTVVETSEAETSETETTTVEESTEEETSTEETETESITEEETTEVETETTSEEETTLEDTVPESVEIEESAPDEVQIQSEEADTTEATVDTTSTQVTSNFPVIIDTDFASDADDMLAVRLGLIYQDLGYINIKAIMLSTSYSKSPEAVSALCRWDGHEGIPIGMNTKTIVHVGGGYVDKLCELGHGYSSYTDTTKLYRKILAESDTKVEIITLGFMQNISDLINSQPDEYSPLNGVQLMMEKVDKVYVVGSNLANTISFNFYWTGETVINAAKNVNTNCPVEIVYLVTDAGKNVWNGSYHSSDTKGQDIVSAAMKANDQGSGVGGCDTMCLLEVIIDLYQLNDLEDIQKQYGTMYISNSGAAVFTQSEGNVNVSNRSRLLPGGTYTGQYYASKIDQLLYAKHKTFLNN